MYTTYNPKWQKYAKLYKINDLAFQGQWSIKNSDLIKEFLLPTDTMQQPKNPKGDYLWQRYKQSALYVNYPAKYLKQALGLATKQKYQLQLPTSMQKIEDYATLQNLSLQAIQNQLIEYIIKFGSALLITKIPDQVQIAKDTPKIDVIPGCNVLDGETYYDKQAGLDRFKRLVYYQQQYSFNKSTNSYNLPQIYVYVLGLNADGIYYEAKMKQDAYTKFNWDNPQESKDMLVYLSYPKWISFLDFIPAVFINKDTLKLEWKQSPIQNLIDISLSIFQLTADMRFLMHQQSSSTLVISGTDMENKSVRTGVGNVINLTDSGANASYIAPAVAGLQSMQDCLENQHNLAENQLLSLVDVGKVASGQALSLRISDKTSELIGIISVIGKSIQRQLEIIAQVMNENIDKVIFTPYIGFASANNTEQTTEKVQNIEKDTEENNK